LKQAKELKNTVELLKSEAVKLLNADESEKSRKLMSIKSEIDHIKVRMSTESYREKIKELVDSRRIIALFEKKERCGNDDAKNYTLKPIFKGNSDEDAYKSIEQNMDHIQMPKHMRVKALNYYVGNQAFYAWKEMKGMTD
jgi:hypothetical protein